MRLRPLATLLPLLLLVGCGTEQAGLSAAPSSATATATAADPATATPTTVGTPTPVSPLSPGPATTGQGMTEGPERPPVPGKDIGPSIERVEPAAADLAEAEAAIPRARAALEPLLGRRPATDADVRTALVGAGFPRDRVTAVGHGVGVAVGGVRVTVSYGSACLFGEITTQRVDLVADGATYAEGCAPAGVTR